MARTAVTARRVGRRRRWFRVMLVGFTALMLCIAAELTLRLVWTPPPILDVFAAGGAFWEPEPGAHEPRPGVVARIQEVLPPDAPPSASFEPRMIEVTVNDQGLLGPLLGTKQPQERRILFGGDSLTVGHRVPLARSFPSVACRVLREGGRAATAVNTAVAGYGFRATCKRLRRYRDRAQADVIVAAYFLGNDYQDDIMQRSSAVVGGTVFSGPLGNLLRNSSRARLCVHSKSWLFVESWLVQNWPEQSLMHAYRPTAEQLRLGAMLPDSLVGGLYLDAGLSHEYRVGLGPVVAAWLADVEASFRQLRHDAGELPVLVVVLPSEYHVNCELRGRVLAETGFADGVLELGRSQQRLVDLCRRLGLPCLDTTPVLQAAGVGPELFHVDHVHLSVRGNDVVGRAVAKRVAELLR